MFKKSIYLVLAVVLFGCTYEGQKLSEYVDNPRTIVQDPHYAQHREKLDVLESQYLNKKITYSEYLLQKKELEDKYSKEVQERDAKIGY